MAKIQHKDVTIELFPRKYSETGEDVFIASLLTIEVEQRFIFKFYGSLLLESEFQDLLFYMRTLLNGTSDKYLLNPVEPYLIHMYQQMDAEQQKLMMHLIEVVMVDTVSHVFGVIDGSSPLIDSDIEATVLLDDVDTEGELQDSFIGYLQEEDLYP